jgi:hypothetical protein
VFLSLSIGPTHVTTNHQRVAMRFGDKHMKWLNKHASNHAFSSMTLSEAFRLVSNNNKTSLRFLFSLFSTKTIQR